MSVARPSHRPALLTADHMIAETASISDARQTSHRRKERASEWNIANGLSVRVGAILIGEVHLAKKDLTIYPRPTGYHS